MKKLSLLIFLLAVIAVVAVMQQVPTQDGGVSDDAAQETSSPAPGAEIPADIEQIMLADVSGGGGTGIATRLTDNEGLFVHTVDATLPEPTDGSVYEGWLVRGKPGDADFDFISTGVMEVEGGGLYSLVFSSEADYTGYAGVVITEETIVDATPEAHILEGSF